jgi:hypothetical protein
MAVRGKFKLVESTQVDWNKDARKLKFQAACNDGTEENAKFHKATPTGEIAMTVDNPSAVEQFEIGKHYYVDFTAAP